MIFCPKCGTILKPKEKAGKKIMWCSCGFTTERQVEEKEVEKKEVEEKRIEIVEELERHPKVEAKCEKCEHNEAYYWTQQTRSADEPETRFFKCTKCQHTWREYA